MLLWGSGQREFKAQMLVFFGDGSWDGRVVKSCRFSYGEDEVHTFAW